MVVAILDCMSRKMYPNTCKWHIKKPARFCSDGALFIMQQYIYSMSFFLILFSTFNLLVKQIHCYCSVFLLIFCVFSDYVTICTVYF